MYKELIDFGPEVTLVANSALQFLDFGFALEDRQQGPGHNFAETEDPQDPEMLRLRKLYLDEDEELRDVQSDEVFQTDASYVVSLKHALSAFDDAWLPLPFLKVLSNASSVGAERFERGPTVWSRMRVKKLDTPDSEGNNYRVTIGFDTRFEKRNPSHPYTMITPDDVENPCLFELPGKLEEFAWFLDQDWVMGWLRKIHEEALAKGRINRLQREDDSYAQLTHWAAYVTLLEGLTEKISVPRVRFIDTISDPAPNPPFDVDLVLDIGNNRTCGVLVEHSSDGNLQLDQNARRLEIRDLEQLEYAYSKPFESRVEFREVSYGNRRAIKDAGARDSLFRWPSYLRVGDEARRLNGASVGSEGVSGLSAPKRYLWDDRPREQEWSLNITGQDRTDSLISGKLMVHVTEAGDLVHGGDEFAFQAKFSRASLFSFQVMEILLHAIRQINEPAHRWSCGNSNVPRRLRNIILTVPSATPVVEQREFQRRAQDGLDLVWETMEWSDPERRQFEKPEMKIAYDEASCTQLVFLYSEIVKRYQRTAEEYVSLKAPLAFVGEERPRIRIASIDIGGGTTDLMISTYSVEAGQPHVMKMEQNFREGFRLAGDDIVRQVISQHVLAGIATGLRDCNLADPHGFLTRLLNDANSDAQGRQRRILFVNQVLSPIAHSLLGLYEKTGAFEGRDGIDFADAFDAQRIPTEALTDFFDEAARDAGAEQFSIRNVRFPMVAQRMSRTISDVISANMQVLSEVIAQFGCDYLLLTGRPSRLPAIRDLVMSSMAVPPHRILSMHEYEIGNWYPFAGSGNLIGDPKTTVVVGGLICSLAEDGRLDNFGLPPGSFTLPSTARTIGLLDIAGAMIEDHILFRADDDGNFPEESEEIRYNGPLQLGFRQIDSPTWPATPLYRLHVPADQLDDVVRRSFPLRVRLEKPEQNEMARRRGAKPDESFKIGRVLREDGSDAQRASRRLRLQMQTMMEADGFWTDTGNVKVPTDL